MKYFILLVSSCLMVIPLITSSANCADRRRGTYFSIQVVDEDTHRGIPAVKLTTTNGISYWTDSFGRIAFYEPELMNQDVYFTIESFGYEFPKDEWFGFQGERFQTVPGKQVEIRMKRINIAQRLYRFTGEGIFRDSLLLGHSCPAMRQAHTSPIMGQDGHLNVYYKNKMFWIWGDTAIRSFPLGIFRATAATSELPRHGGLDPDKGIRFKYFRDDDTQVRRMVNSELKPIWLIAPRVCRDSKTNQEILFANYINGFDNQEKGIVVFNDQTEYFDPYCKLPLNDIMDIEGYAFTYHINETGYFSFGANWGSIRTPVTLESACDPCTWEAFSCLKEGTKYNQEKSLMDRDPHGTLIWGWKKATSPMRETEMEPLIQSGLLRTKEKWYDLRSPTTFQSIKSHSGTIYWNQYRQRWISIRVEKRGLSPLGEIWYFEGDTALGPWVYGQKIVTHAILHDDPKHNEYYSFYLPAQYPKFDKEQGKIIYFAGTFTSEFSGMKVNIPRYDYNGIMYSLDLSDPRLYLPVPVYSMLGKNGKIQFRTKTAIKDYTLIHDVPFFAPDRPRKGTIGVYETLNDKIDSIQLTLSPTSSTNHKFIFYGVSPSAFTESMDKNALIPLYEYVHKESQKRYYSIHNTPPDGYESLPAPLVYVWKNPISFHPFKLNFQWMSTKG